MHYKPSIFATSDWFDEHYFRYMKIPETKQIREVLNDRRFNVAETSATYRVINSWDCAGLLIDQEERGNKWRKFNYIDIIWVRIILQLRSLIGFPVQKVAIFKESFFPRSLKTKQIDTSILEFYIALAIFEKMQVIIAIAPSGEGGIATENEYLKSQIVQPLPTTHIVISLNKICAEVLGRPDLAKKSEFLHRLTENEFDLIARIHSDTNLKDVTIHPKDQKIDRIDYKTQYRNPKKIHSEIKKHMNSSDFQEITLKQNKGEVSLMEVVTKKR